MFSRTISPLILQRLRDYSAVALVGPRQSGKTTLARRLGKRYFDLEFGGESWAIEVKLTSRATRDDLASLNRNADLIDADRRFLVCRRAELLESRNQTVCDLEGMLDRLK